jgi:hypothetical protein
LAHHICPENCGDFVVLERGRTQTLATFKILPGERSQ